MSKTGFFKTGILRRYFKMIKVKVNGKIKEVKKENCILDFLKETGIDIESVIIAYNRVVIKKEILGKTFFKEGDELEILRITAGG
jgi:thiamine biosynthesis protein ThiS